MDDLEVILDSVTEDVTESVTIRNAEQESKISKFRRWFREAADYASDWQDEAQEDYDFVSGKQWSDADKKALERSGRPAITINRIKPLINVLSGYQRLNRYDVEFLPRTDDDSELCQVRKGLTKYILDRSDFDTHESVAFLDASVCGIGWLEVGYKFDEELDDGEAFVRREDPFGMYIDPEAHALDFSDAKYICRAKWADKEELKDVFPEHAEEIDAQYSSYDSEEHITGKRNDNNLWYKRETDKVRLVECWYKVREPKTIYYLSDGTAVPQEEISVEMFMQGAVVGEKTVTVTKVKMCSFFDEVLLEDIYSPYEHGEFPFIPVLCYHYGAGDLPAGFVRDLKDPQREINKRRVQILHILNTTGNGGGWMEEDAMSNDQKAEFKRNGNIPGHYQEVRTGALSQGKIQERGLASPPNGIIQAETQATADLTSISGINEALMGTDVANTSSGRAIELRQKQAITHIAPMFDNLRKAKKKMTELLWGRRGHKGIIPQYYTEEKAFRIEGENGQQFIRINQQVIERDMVGNIIHRTLNDLSQGEFDVVISDTQASVTQRQAQMWSLIDAVSKLGIAGDLVFDIIISLSDLPHKDEIKQRYLQRQQAQQQATEQQAQHELEMEQIKNQNLNQHIAFKDAPTPIQFAMAAKQGLIDPQIAEYAIKIMVQQMFPQLAYQMDKEQKAQAQQQAQMAQMQQLVAALQGGQQQQQQLPPLESTLTPEQLQQKSPALTEAASNSLRAGQIPAL